MPFGQNNNPSYRGGSVRKTVNWRNIAISLIRTDNVNRIERNRNLRKKNMEGRHVGLDFYDLLIEVLKPGL